MKLLNEQPDVVVWCNDLRADIRYHKLCKNVTKAARSFSDINSTFIGASCIIKSVDVEN